MRELKQTMQRAREFIAANLAECCRDELDWQKSSILRDGKLREAAAIFGEVDKTHAIPMAQSETARQAMQLACRTQPEATKPAQDLSVAIDWLRNNYQDHTNIASLCDAMCAALASPADALVAVDARKLNWGDVSRPSKEIGYDHVIAQTPFGRVLITWKGWKDYPSFEIEDHPLEIVRNWCGSSLESAKEEAERAYFEAIDAAMREQP